MLQELINHNSDIRQLSDEGYHLEFNGGYLLIHHIPYVNSDKQVKFGTLISSLMLNGYKVRKPDNHVIQFIGEQPCNANGEVITSIMYIDQPQHLGNGITINRSFSNKPQNGYEDYYEKFGRYAEIISAPAKSLNPEVTDKPFLPMRADTDSVNDVFQYVDTNSSRANIGFINEKLKNQRIGIVGLGGTGAYILDLVAKTCVQEIHLFDNDIFCTHNAFRSPGAGSFEDLNKQYSKVDYYSQIYSKMHKNIFPNKIFLFEENLNLLLNLDFVFLSIDNNVSRKIVAGFLYDKGIPFIDGGIGVELVDDKLTSVIRVSSFPQGIDVELEERLPLVETPDNAYNSNIQIAELNSLNATLAVIKWKKIMGFYSDVNLENHSVYCSNANQLTDECT